MNNYIIGGWSQRVSEIPPTSFAYTMYGMITNLSALTSGTLHSPGWTPKTVPAPSTSGKVLWTYGGGGCSPIAKPDSDNEIADIIEATNKNWDGVDFDDECNMNIDGIINTMKQLRPKQTSYSFIAGWAYNNPKTSSVGKIINEKIQKLISVQDICDRFIHMCYAEKMWSMEDITRNVSSSLDRTIGYGVEPKKIILALTPVGLNQQNLDYFLNQVISKKLGGLFIWEFNKLKINDLNSIINTLKIQNNGVHTQN